MFHFKNLESWCVVNKEKITLICMDDKAKIPVGQPGTPKAATSLMQKRWTAKGVTLESSDHNYHPASIYMFKVNNRDTRTRCEICSKLTLNRKMQAGHAINLTTSANLLCETRRA